MLMRFPTTKMALQWSNLKNLTMRNEAQIKIETWSPSVGSKGRLQTAWFRVNNIPADQRSIRTLAKVGGLVEKVIAVDEGSQYRYDYVRLHIACRDVTRVPKTAEGTLGLNIIDFSYERELPDEPSSKVLKSGIVVTEDQQAPMKKAKADTPVIPTETNAGTSMSISKGTPHNSGKEVQDVYWSAPPNINFKPRSQTKLLADAQKSYKGKQDDEEDGKVHILDTFEESNSDSDSFSVQVQQLTGMKEDQVDKGEKGAVI